MALYKYHLRSSLRFFIAPQVTKQRKAHTECCSRRRHHHQRQRRKHQKSEHSWAQPDIDRTHATTKQWTDYKFCICKIFDFATSDACDTWTTTIFRMFDQLCLSPQFGQKQKFSSLAQQHSTKTQLSFSFGRRNFASATFRADTYSFHSQSARLALFTLTKWWASVLDGWQTKHIKI